jgi:hypothetical protein
MCAIIRYYYLFINPLYNRVEYPAALQKVVHSEFPSPLRIWHRRSISDTVSIQFLPMEFGIPHHDFGHDMRREQRKAVSHGFGSPKLVA